MQSTFMSAGEINETNVYLTTGNPLRNDINKMVNLMFNETFANCSAQISELKNTKGLALTDIVRDVYPYVMKLSIPDDTKMYLLEQMSDIEYRLSVGTNEKIQLSSLIGCFQLARESVASKKPIGEVCACD